MRRREFIAGIGTAATFGSPGAAPAQQPAARRIGLVSIGADPAKPVVFGPLLRSMKILDRTLPPALLALADEVIE